ncbi:MAG: TonB family protein [Betaproteobacteria bacterium]|nr:TonB family protein [Betaproteobacteria bacterium]
MAAYAAPREPGRVPAAVLAGVVHILFFIFLTFSVSWKTRAPETMVVDLWSAPPSAPVAAPAATEPRPAPARPVEPEVKPQPRPETPKADIELKEKERLKKEEQKRQEAEKRRLDEKKAQEALRQQQLREAQEASRIAQEQERVAREMQARRAAEQSRVVEDYKARIKAKIQRFIVLPPDVPPAAQAEFDVVLLPSGDVLGARIKRSSNHKAYDDAVERAIYKAQPLPLPPDPAMFRDFRELNLRFRPAE